jgi:hypothetical protein
MNISTLSIPLTTTAEQVDKLIALQNAFAMVCNALAPVVRDTRCWSRVALHHMMYRSLREQFPQIGSQMVCNAIYSVSRTSRLIFQAEQSPFNIQRYADKTLPLLQFLPTAPVYFDRHTLSIKPGSLSMYTLDGRMRFEVNLSAEDLARFKTLKLSEVVLNHTNSAFTLNFSFVDGQALGEAEDAAELLKAEDPSLLPEYVVVEQSEEGALVHSAASALSATLAGHAPQKEPHALNAQNQQVQKARQDQQAQSHPRDPLNSSPPPGSSRPHSQVESGPRIALMLQPATAMAPFMTQVVPKPQPESDMKLKTVVMHSVTGLSGVNVTIKQESVTLKPNTPTGASS